MRKKVTTVDVGQTPMVKLMGEKAFQEFSEIAKQIHQAEEARKGASALVVDQAALKNDIAKSMDWLAARR